MKRYWSGSHTKHRLRYHVVWIPKRRKRLLQKSIVGRLTEIIYEGCHMNKWWVEELSIQKDHVHMLIQIKPQESISSVIKRIKGVSSRLLRQEYPELEEFLWGDSLWCDGYFAVTVGEVDELVVKRYISNQGASMT